MNANNSNRSMELVSTYDARATALTTAPERELNRGAEVVTLLPDALSREVRNLRKVVASMRKEVDRLERKVTRSEVLLRNARIRELELRQQIFKF